MMKNTLVKGTLLAIAAAALSACEPVAPTNPTWEQDVRPLMVARCIRCHNATPGKDPSAKPGNLAYLKATMYNFDYKTVGEIPVSILAIMKLSAPCARGDVPMFMMPPPPAEKLETWQIDMLDTWAKNQM